MSKSTKKPTKANTSPSASSKKSGSRKSPAGKAGAKRQSRLPPKKGRVSRVFGFLLKLSAVGCVLLAAWCVYLDATVRAKFEGKRWQLPAQVYARPMELYPSASLSRNALINELKLLGYDKVSGRPHRAGSYQAGASGSGKSWLAVHSRGFRFADGIQQGQVYRITFANNTVSAIVDNSGRELSWVRLEPTRIGGIYPALKEDRLLINIAQVPESLVRALIQIEDKDFYHHFGISIRGIARAMVANLKAGRFVQGGSTLTQQLVKNFYLDQRQTLWRKFNEALMAMLLEFHYEKAEILEAYLNEIFLGQDGERAVHGIGLASQFYFARPVENLSPEQSALLVAIVKGASYYNPRRNPERAMQRRNLVLSEMAKAGYLNETQLVSLSSSPLGVVAKPKNTASLYPAFMDLVKSQLARDYRAEDLQTEGLQIFTTLDPAVQHKAEQALSTTLEAKSRQAANQGLEGALVSTSVGSGEVLAVVGGKDPRFAGFNRALAADRQIGSLVKPFVYLTALSTPGRFTLATKLPDEPFRIKFNNGDSWQPNNFDGEARGDVIMQKALSESLNLATARLGLLVEVESVLATLRKLGAKADVPPYPSVLLGALSLTPIEVAALYQNLVSTGFRVPLRAIRAVTRPDGELLSRYSFETEQVLDAGVAYIGQFALYDVMRSGTGKRVYQTFPEDYFIGGKTGTTDDFRDSWFVGFNGDMLTTVWMGKDNNKPTSLTGSSGAMEAWLRLYKSLPRTSFIPMAPDSVEWAWVDEKEGLLAAEDCQGAIALPFIQGSVPTVEGPCIERKSSLQRWLDSWWN